MHCTVIIPAAGTGTRFGSEVPKQYALLDGEPILVRTIERLLGTGLVTRIIVATAAEDRWWEPISKSKGWAGVDRVEGGKTRQASVMAALGRTGNSGLVAVHDAVRPYFRKDTLERLLEAAEELGAAVPALPVRETVHRVVDQKIRETPDRSELWTVQTPQCFRAELLQHVMERAWQERYSGTDEASLVAHYDHPVRVIEGDAANIKITRPDDLLLVEGFLKRENP